VAGSAENPVHGGGLGEWEMVQQDGEEIPLQWWWCRAVVNPGSGGGR